MPVPSFPNFGTEPLIGSEIYVFLEIYLKFGIGNPWALQSRDKADKLGYW